MNTFLDKVKENLTTVVITSLVAIITIFSDKITGAIRFELNKADLRIESYDKITVDLSNYVFEAENVTESYKNGWTTKSLLPPVVASYNASIVIIRKQEYVNYALLKRFWGNEQQAKYGLVIETIKKIDTQVHMLSEETDLVINYNKPKADKLVTQPVTNNLIILDKELKTRVQSFFDALAK